MPESPPTRCAERGCGELVARGYCPEHTRNTWDRRSDGRNGSTRRGRKLRARVLAEAPTCQCAGCPRCTSTGCAAPSTDDDHVMAVAEGGALLDRGNHQALCHPCHLEKTARERSARLVRARC